MANAQIASGVFRMWGGNWKSTEANNWAYLYLVDPAANTVVVGGKTKNSEPAGGTAIVDGTDYYTFKPDVTYSYWYIQEVDTTNHYYWIKPWRMYNVFAYLEWPLTYNSNQYFYNSDWWKVNCTVQRNTSNNAARWYFTETTSSYTTSTVYYIQNVDNDRYLCGGTSDMGYSAVARTSNGTRAKWGLSRVSASALGNEVWIKIGGIWRIGIPYVKATDGKWHRRDTTQIKISNGTWK